MNTIFDIPTDSPLGKLITTVMETSDAARAANDENAAVTLRVIAEEMARNHGYSAGSVGYCAEQGIELPWADGDLIVEGVVLRGVPSDKPIRSFVGEREVLRKREGIAADAYADGKLFLRWTSNNRLVPPWVFTEARLEIPPEHKAAYEAETAEAIERYRATQPAEPSDEERFEARAAFGPGVVVVDAITGRRFTT